MERAYDILNQRQAKSIWVFAHQRVIKIINSYRHRRSPGCGEPKVWQSQREGTPRDYFVVLLGRTPHHDGHEPGYFQK